MARANHSEPYPISQGWRYTAEALKMRWNRILGVSVSRRQHQLLNRKVCTVVWKHHHQMLRRVALDIMFLHSTWSFVQTITSVGFLNSHYLVKLSNIVSLGLLLCFFLLQYFQFSIFSLHVLGTYIVFLVFSGQDILFGIVFTNLCSFFFFLIHQHQQQIWNPGIYENMLNKMLAPQT